MWETIVTEGVEDGELRSLFEKGNKPTEIGQWIRNNRANDARNASRSRPITDALLRTAEVLFIMISRPKLNVQNNGFDFKSILKNGSHLLTKVSRFSNPTKRALVKCWKGGVGSRQWREIQHGRSHFAILGHHKNEIRSLCDTLCGRETFHRNLKILIMILRGRANNNTIKICKNKDISDILNRANRFFRGHDLEVFKDHLIKIRNWQELGGFGKH